MRPLRDDTHDPDAVDAMIDGAFDRHGDADTKSGLSDLSSAIGRAWDREADGLRADLARGLAETFPDAPRTGARDDRLEWSLAACETPYSWRHVPSLGKKVAKSVRRAEKEAATRGTDVPSCVTAYHEALLARIPVYAAVLERFEAVKADLPARMERAATVRREARERTFEGTGSCGCCSMNVKMDADDRLVDHGFTILRGAREGGCVGVGLLPFEMSPEGAEAWLDAVHAALAAARGRRERLDTGTVAIFRHDARAGERVPLLPGEDGYDRVLAVAKASVDAEIRSLERDAERTEARVASWEPAPLPDGRADHVPVGPTPTP